MDLTSFVACDRPCSWLMSFLIPHWGHSQGLLVRMLVPTWLQTETTRTLSLKALFYVTQPRAFHKWLGQECFFFFIHSNMYKSRTWNPSPQEAEAGEWVYVQSRLGYWINRIKSCLKNQLRTLTDGPGRSCWALPFPAGPSLPTALFPKIAGLSSACSSW